MPVYLDKTTGRFYIEFQYKGKRYKERLSSGVKKSEAEKIEIRLKSELFADSHGIRSDITYEQFLKQYFSPHIENSYCSDSFEKAVYVLRASLPFLKGKTMRSIKPADIELFKIERSKKLTQHGSLRKPATVVRELAIISKVFSLAVKNDICDYNPCNRIEKPKFDNVQNKVLKREHEESFFVHMHSEWARDVCRFVLNTGLRQNDVMNLKRFGIDRQERKITIIQGKTKRRVEVALNDVAIEILDRRWHNGSTLLFPSPKSGTEKGSVRHAMQRACARAKIPTITIRDLRRTFATRGLENGADAVTVADALGHTDLRMISRYVRSFDNKRKLVESFQDSPKVPPEAIRKIK
jgi:integrase